MKPILWHNSYTRYEALEIIREQAFCAAVDEGESFMDCHKTAEHIYKFYLKVSNQALEGQLEDIFDFRPLVTD